MLAALLVQRANLVASDRDALDALMAACDAIEVTRRFGSTDPSVVGLVASATLLLHEFGRSGPHEDRARRVLDRSLAEAPKGRMIGWWQLAAGCLAWSRWRAGRAPEDAEAGRHLLSRAEREDAAGDVDHASVRLLAAHIHLTNAITGAGGELPLAAAALHAAELSEAAEPATLATIDRVRAGLDAMIAGDPVDARQLMATPVEADLPSVQPADEVGAFRADGDTAHLDRAIDTLARRAAGPGDYLPDASTAQTLVELAEVRRLRGLAPRTGGTEPDFESRALEEYGLGVLLAENTAAGLSIAREGNRRAERMVRWALEEGDLERAVKLLEAGRGLVLDAATTATRVGDLLRRGGHDALADAWQSPVDSGRSVELQRDALAVASSTPSSISTFSPLMLMDYSPMLWHGGFDAVVYLVAGSGGPGAAVLVRANQRLEHLPLPLLDSSAPKPLVAVLDAYPGAFGERDVSALDVTTDLAATRWRAATDELCDWAHEAVVGPLLAHTAAWGMLREPRLALIPGGSLGRVPWHAARQRRPDGTVRYACQDAVLSYAASAGQLRDATRRPRLPLAAAPVVVANPTGTQLWTSFGGEAVHEVFYPDGVFLGHPAARSEGHLGTPEEVLRWLPAPGREGASMLQLSTHATARPDPTESRFELAGGRLSVADVLEQARGRAVDAAGGLVICDSCTTDLTEADHDEVLTLGTAFLAAGAVGVIGARWPLDEGTAALVIFMLHHFLAEGLQPADALSRAQRWMLDPYRTLPARLPPVLAQEARRPELAEPFAWAAFTHQGQ